MFTWGALPAVPWCMQTMFFLSSEIQEDSGNDWRVPLLQQPVVKIKAGMDISSDWTRKCDLNADSVLLSLVSVSGEGLGWAEGKCSQAVGRGGNSCQGLCEVSSIIQTPSGQPLPSQSSPFPCVSTLVFWRVRRGSLYYYFLSSISWLRLGGNPVSHQPSWICVTSSLSISVRKLRSKELSVWNKSLQSWREGVLMLPNFAGMKWNLQRSWRKWNICSVVTLGSPDEHWGPSVADAFHTDAAGVLALVTAASPLVP